MIRSITTSGALLAALLPLACLAQPATSTTASAGWRNCGGADHPALRVHADCAKTADLALQARAPRPMHPAATQGLAPVAQPVMATDGSRMATR